MDQLSSAAELLQQPECRGGGLPAFAPHRQGVKRLT
jgi:hypothetical protein